MSIWFKKRRFFSAIINTRGEAMTQQEKVELVQTMQDYILGCAAAGVWNPGELYQALGYSKRHADRLFKELLGITPGEYCRKLRLTGSADSLLDKSKSVLEVALEADFASHEGYTKAFTTAFGIPPSQYKTGRHPIPLFVPYPVKDYYTYAMRKEEEAMAEPMCLCTVIPVERPQRKLIFMRSQKATDYFSFCEEAGCDWEGLFNSIPSKLDTAALLTLPAALTLAGGSPIAAGVEVTWGYDGDIPPGCEIVEIGPVTMLYFQSQSYTTDEEFFPLMGAVIRAVEGFDAVAYGYRHADDTTPRFNFGGQPEKGARLAIAVSRAPQ